MGFFIPVVVLLHRLSVCPEDKSIVLMPGVGWPSGRLLSVSDEGPSGGGEDKNVENLYIEVPKSRRTLWTCTEYALNMDAHGLSQRGLNSNISKIETVNHINSSTLPSP